MVDKLIIFYFTGTGNALAASNWIAETALGKNIQVDIHKITPSLKVEKSLISANTLIGFCYPTHGFNAPPLVINFLLCFPKMKNRVFLLNTRAGMKLHKIFLPGLSGLAQLFPALILRLKGYRISGLQPMDLPSNWITIHPGLKPKVVDSIFLRCERITKQFANKILSGKKKYKGLLSFPIDLLITPISIAYYFLGRFALSKTFIADNNCNNCGLCQKECPVQAIKTINNRPFWTSKCESCMHCMNSCSKNAIQSPHLYNLVLWWIVFSLVPILAMKELLKTSSFFTENYELFFDVIILISALPILFFSYRILHFLMRFRFFNALINITSLTKYRFWRRYFAPKKYLAK